ncbi:MAG TPA: anti-sigma factor [Kofleriaceae bacterium]
MKPATDPRAQELLLERAMRPLDDREHWELRELGAEDDDSFDLAAAGVALAMTPIEAMPAALADRIAAQAGVASPAASLLPGQMRTLAGVTAPPPSASMTRGAGVAPAQPLATREQPVAPVPEQPSDIDRARERKRSRFAVIAPWLAAAACLVLAVGMWWWTRRDQPGTVVASPSEARQQLLASARDVTTVSWTATADPNAKGASGDVVWSQTEQRGYMRFVGLTPNDPNAFQYQLWIFDKDRDQAFPVDGGVFDVSSTGEVIVPITAKLQVDDATLFAVTIEKPGGVVVSKRERIVVTAARGS